MMDHQDYRRTLLSDPHAENADLQLHRDTCAPCAAYTERLLRFESRLESALRVKVPEPAGLRRSRFALAASVLFALVVVGTIWLALPRSTLAAAVVAHMAGEPNAWSTREAVPNPQLETVLKDANLQLTAGAGVVSYAHSCEFRGHVVPHLVVQSSTGPVTVMILVNESVGEQVQFDEHGYRGVIVPVPGHGSMALLVRRPDGQIQDVEAVAARVRSAVVWSR